MPIPIGHLASYPDLNTLAIGIIVWSHEKTPHQLWLVVDLPSEKYEFVNWDDEIPNNYLEK